METSSHRARASPVSDFKESCRLWSGFVQASEACFGAWRTCWIGDKAFAVAAPTRSDDVTSFIASSCEI